MLLLCVCVLLIAGCGVVLHSPHPESSPTPVRQSAIANQTPDDRAPTSEPETGDSLSNLAYLSGKMNSNKVKERLILLSFKYGVDTAVIEKLLETYLSTHNTFRANSNFQKTLVDLSNTHQVPLEKVAGLVMDYQDWLSCGS